MSRLPRILIGFLLPALLLPTASARADSVFNRLILEKMRLEKQYGITSLECFPFRDNIGFPSDETALVRKCLSGVLTLGAALKEMPDSGLRLVGISHRFLRSGGFHSLLIPWNAAPKEIMAALRANPPPEAQKKFIAEIHRLKQQILSGLRIRQLYCTFKISNEQCMQGYRTLA
nr:hypothetical protein [Nitrospinaceae bacterium]NIR54800.1 hypothetical protein [Nitrospinaceae bacterium]NIS85225.1 hypothetical protein [Nitrospinaceae bacterium]NIT82038.1 hypothetical protein [Nitrospinaceae bacterium]NIU44299.1 hypothetical protein [Nitrospinaceae bacterium]